MQGLQNFQYALMTCVILALMGLIYFNERKGK